MPRTHQPASLLCGTFGRAHVSQREAQVGEGNSAAVVTDLMTRVAGD